MCFKLRLFFFCFTFLPVASTLQSLQFACGHKLQLVWAIYSQDKPKCTHKFNFVHISRKSSPKFIHEKTWKNKKDAGLYVCNYSRINTYLSRALSECGCAAIIFIKLSQMSTRMPAGRRKYVCIFVCDCSPRGTTAFSLLRARISAEKDDWLSFKGESDGNIFQKKKKKNFAFQRFWALLRILVWRLNISIKF